MKRERDNAYPPEIGASRAQDAWPYAYFTKENTNINKYSLGGSAPHQRR